MNVSDNMLRIAERMAAKHSSDIDRAVDEADKAIRKLPEFDGLVATLVRGAIQEMVYDARHRANVRIKTGLGLYGGPAKIVVGESSAVCDAAESAYTYFIAGMTLGMVLGKDLPAIAESEASIADGHAFNAELCKRLVRLVPANERVQDVLSEKRLDGVFRSVKRKIEN